MATASASSVVLPRADRARSLQTTELNREDAMLNTILVVLVVLWLLGMVTQYTLGGFIHVLLFLAVAMVLIRIIQGRKPIS
jgi:asparagine N-glycosylation enzyme membrane subunit Stt3